MKVGFSYTIQGSPEGSNVEVKKLPIFIERGSLKKSLHVIISVLGSQEIVLENMKSKLDF